MAAVGVAGGGQGAEMAVDAMGWLGVKGTTRVSTGSWRRKDKTRTRRRIRARSASRCQPRAKIPGPSARCLPAPLLLHPELTPYLPTHPFHCQLCPPSPPSLACSASTYVPSPSRPRSFSLRFFSTPRVNPPPSAGVDQHHHRNHGWSRCWLRFLVRLLSLAVGPAGGGRGGRSKGSWLDGRKGGVGDRDGTMELTLNHPFAGTVSVANKVRRRRRFPGVGARVEGARVC